MRWISNTGDPKGPNACMDIVRCSYETQKEAWERHLLWLSDKIIGRPKETETYTVEELEKMGMVGVYSRKESGK